MDDKKAESNRRGDRERSKGIDMLKIQSRNKTMTQDLEEFRKKAVHNQGHLNQGHLIREMKGMWDQLPKEIHSKTKPRIEEFELAPTRLDLDACLPYLEPSLLRSSPRP